MKKQDLISVILTIFIFINITWSIINKTRSNELRNVSYELEDIAIQNTYVSDSLTELSRMIRMEYNNLIQNDTSKYKIVGSGTITTKATGSGKRHVQEIFYIDTTKRIR